MMTIRAMIRVVYLTLAVFLCAFLNYGCSPVIAVLEPTASVAPSPSYTPSASPIPVTPTFTTIPSATPIPATPTLSPTPSATPTMAPAFPTPPDDFDYSRLPGWFAYMDFDCQRMICTNVSIIRPDFSGRKLVTDHEHGLSPYLYWAPDGKSLALTFYTLGDEAHAELRLATLKNKQEKVLISVKSGSDIKDVAWSPDGRFLTYTLYPQSDKTNRQIFKLAVGSLSKVDLTGNTEYSDEMAVWSPDGKTIAFASNRQNPKNMKHKIWLMKPDGSDPNMLVPGDDHPGWDDFFPRWSPDGKKLAFSRIVDENAAQSGIWVMYLDSSQIEQVIACSSPSEEPPLWSPDGRYIVATCGGQEHTDVILFDFMKKTSFRLNDTQHFHYSVSWSPDSKALLYVEKVADMRRMMHLVLLTEDQIYQISATTDFENPVWSRAVVPQ